MCCLCVQRWSSLRREGLVAVHKCVLFVCAEMEFFDEGGFSCCTQVCVVCVCRDGVL